jgi:hypothetical protein
MRPRVIPIEKEIYPRKSVSSMPTEIDANNEKNIPR